MTPDLIGILSVGVALAALIVGMTVRLTGRMDRLDDRQVAAVEAQLAGFDRLSLLDLEARLDGLESGIGGLNARLVRLESRFTGLESQFAGLEARFATLESQFSDMQAQVAAMDSRLTVVESQIVALQSQVAGVTSPGRGGRTAIGVPSNAAKPGLKACSKA